MGGTDLTFDGYRATRYVRDKLASERILAQYPETEVEESVPRSRPTSGMMAVPVVVE